MSDVRAFLKSVQQDLSEHEKMKAMSSEQRVEFLVSVISQEHKDRYTPEYLKEFLEEKKSALSSVIDDLWLIFDRKFPMARPSAMTPERLAMYFEGFLIARGCEQVRAVTLSFTLRKFFYRRYSELYD